MASDVQEPTTTEAEASPYGELQVDVPALTALLDGEYAEIRDTVRDGLTVRTSTLGEDVVLVGAAVLVLAGELGVS